MDRSLVEDYGLNFLDQMHRIKLEPRGTEPVNVLN